MGRKLDPKVQPYRKADGTMTYRVRLRANGRQTTETFDSEAAAIVFAARVKDPAIGPERAIELRDREDAASPGYVPTVREALEKHIRGLTGIEVNTKTDYAKVAERSWLPMLGALRVDELTRDDVADWVNAAAGKSPKTIRNAHSVLSATLNTAVLDGHIGANPARGTRLPRAGEEDVDEPNFLTHAEFDLLYAEIPEDARPLVVWMFGMGTRWGETTAQQVRDVDMAAGQYVGEDWVSTPLTNIRRAWKQNPRRLGPPKSKAGRRSVLLPSEVVDVVEPLLDRPGDAWLFTTPTGKAVSHANFFNRVWKPATMRASICEQHRQDGCLCLGSKPYRCPLHTEVVGGKRIVQLPDPCGCPGTLPFRPRIHDARHTHASWLIAQGVELEVIQERLGHEDYLTTRRLYTHLMPDAQLKASAAASAAFTKTQLAVVRRPLELES